MENTNGKEPAFPLITKGGVIQDGLTKREYFAAMAMQGILACGKPFVSDSIAVAKDAVLYADALLTQLNNK